MTTGPRLWLSHRLRCCVPGCGKAGPDPHHVVAKGMGGVADEDAADEENLAPLCRVHHVQCHAIGHDTFQEIHQIDLLYIATFVWGGWLKMSKALRQEWKDRASGEWGLAH